MFCFVLALFHQLFPVEKPLWIYLTETWTKINYYQLQFQNLQADAAAAEAESYASTVKDEGYH